MDTLGDGPSDVVGRSAALLRALSQHEPAGASTSRLARDTGLPRPSVHRLLSALAGEGLADRDQQTGSWLLGPDVYVLGVAAGPRYDATTRAHSTVRRLSDETGESAFFSFRRGDETVCMIREDGAFPLRSHVLSEGARFPLGVVSAGMAILAYLPDREVDAYLERTDLTGTWGPQHTTAEVRAHLARTRLTGYAVNPGLIVQGSWGMAAPVFDRAGQPRWALSLTGVEHRFARPRQEELGALLLREAHRLSQTLQRRTDR